jgi:A/G-specific adenine glycosylase
MNSQERFFVKTLLSWFNENKREFPWRVNGKTNPYHILVAELMLKKTRADNASAVYTKFIELFPTPDSILNTSDADMESILRPLGLIKQRKKAFFSIFSKIMEIYGGKIPSQKKDLHELPYVGDYTVNAVLCFGFNKKVPIVDVNVTRICQRFFGLEAYGDPRIDTHIWELLDRIIPRNRFKEFNLALLDFGALVCKSKKPECELCTLRENCLTGSEKLIRKFFS